MGDSDLLEQVLLEIGVKRGLDEKLLRDLFKVMLRDQFIPDGQRSPVRAELERIIRRHVRGEGV